MWSIQIGWHALPEAPSVFPVDCCKLACAALFLATPVASSLRAQTAGRAAMPSHTLVAMRGNDTVAVEQITPRERGLHIDVVLRSPRTTLTSYDVFYTTDSRPLSLTTTTYDPQQGFTARPVTVDHVDHPAGSGIPFIDVVHWPVELMLQRIMNATADTLTPSLVSRSGMVPIRITRLGANRFTATHPSHGVMEIETDADGQLVRLTAGNGTPPLRVTRGTTADIAALAAEFARRDAAGRGPGDPSGRDEPSTPLH